MKTGFFDPLYKVVVLQDPHVFQPRSALSSRKQDLGLYGGVTPLIKTAEFTRLARLRQAGLLYLLFPSMTHTRYAHSLGCCHLGDTACVAVGVIDPDEQGTEPVDLGEWLDRHKWRDEFLIALLLHDLGQFAFSHMMEINTILPRLLNYTPNHEEATCQLILGEGVANEAFVGNNPTVAHVPRVAEVLRQGGAHLDIRLICYLISGNPQYLDGRDARLHRQAKIMHALTSGLLDLDRIDHYRRDSEFIGLDIGFNYQALLHGLQVVGEKDGSPGIKLRLQQSAVGHAITLLHLRERLTVDCFMTSKALALDAMANWALSQFLLHISKNGEGQARLRNYLFLCDDELLGMMCRCNEPNVRYIAGRVAAGSPFELLCSGSLKIEKIPTELVTFIENINQELHGKGMVLFKGHPALIKSQKQDKEWMSIENLLDYKGDRLGKSGPYKNQIAHFKRMTELTNREVWFFSDVLDEKNKTHLIDKLRKCEFFEQEI